MRVLALFLSFALPLEVLGAVEPESLVPEPLRRLPKAQIAVTVPPQTYAPYYFDLPSNVSVLRVATLNASGDVDLLVKQGVPHVATTWQGLQQESAYVSANPGGNEAIQVGRNGIPPITAGRWWMTIANPTAQPVSLTLDATFEVSGPAFSVSAGLSGAWFEPRKSGQGYFFQILDATTALAVWFTFDPTGRQAFFIGQGQISGDRVTITNLVKTRGAKFGDAFKASDVVLEDWGDLAFTFDGCNSAYASYLPSEVAFNQGWPAEQLDMDRLTSISGLGCAPTARNNKYLHGGVSGAWFDPRRSGEGWLVEVLNATTAFVFWFSYTPTGEQAWFGSTGTISGGSIVISPALQPIGGRFGPQFHPSQVSLTPWGAYALTFSDCNTAVMAAVGPPAYGSYQSPNLVRLTALAGTNPCGYTVSRGAVSGAIRAPAGSFQDGDVNNPSTPNVDNDSPSQEQVLTNPALVMGYAAAMGTGVEGDRFRTDTDVFDAYTLSMAAGQVIRLAVADHKASAPTEIDLDLFLYPADNTTNPVAVSEGTGPLEQIVVAQGGTFDIVVMAYSKQSSYVLSVDNVAASAAAITNYLGIESPARDGELVVGFDPPLTGPPASTVGTKVRVEALGLKHLAGGANRGPTLVSFAGVGQKAAARWGIVSPDPRDTWTISDPAKLGRHTANLYAKALRGEPGVRFAEPNLEMTPSALPNDPRFREQWHYPLINLPQAWDITTGDQNIVVAVVDTGVAPHPDLSTNLRYELGLDAIRDPLGALDGDGIDANADDPGDRGRPDGGSTFHGTHVAGTIGARTNDGSGVAGVSWRVDLMPVRVLGRGGVGTSYDIAQGIRWATGQPNDSGTVPSRRASVVNLSLGALSPTCPAAYGEVVAAARAAGATIVAAAGNESTSFPSSPANCSGVVSVSAVDLVGLLAPYSNFGATIDVGAPGGDPTSDRNADGLPDGVLSTLATVQGGTRFATFGRLEGTSMASPHVAGVIALMKAAFPGLAPSQFDGLLSSGAITRDLTGNGPSVRDDQFGFGLVDAFKAVSEARRLAIGQVAPPAAVADPNTLDFGATSTAATIRLLNAGQGSLTVSSTTSTQSWLRSAPAQVDGQGLGTYSITVDRNGLFPANYQGQLRYTTSSGTVTVFVGMRVAQAAVPSNIGTLYVLLIDPITGQAAREIEVNPVNGVYSFSLPPALPGNYFVLVGSDIDNDFFICDEGESCGAFTSLSQPSVVPIQGQNVQLPQFAATVDTAILGGNTPAAVGKRAQQFFPKRSNEGVGEKSGKPRE